MFVFKKYKSNVAKSIRILKTRAVFVVLMLSFLFVHPFNSNVDCSAKKTKATASKKIAKSNKKPSLTKKINKKNSNVKKSKNSSKKKKSVRRRSSSHAINFKGTKLTILKDSSLADGIRYKIFKYASKKYFELLHVVEININDTTNQVAVLKANSRISELSKLHDMMNDFNSNSENSAMAAINANFWRAYSYLPIGPVISDGEVIQLTSYKGWSSALFDEKGRLYIDNIHISASLEFNKHTATIENVNHRKDSSGIVLYNRFGGDFIPYVPTSSIEKDLASYFETLEYNDSTEVEIDTALLLNELAAQRRTLAMENSMLKAGLKYCASPALNCNIPCVVTTIDTGTVAVPDNGCILSFGNSSYDHLHMKPGDTVLLRFSTDKYSDIKFMNAITGTPRLVREGIARHEASIEGSKGKRFISHSLPRSAIGTNKNKSVIYLAAMEPPSGKDKRVAANLQNMAEIMKEIGCFNALNLDGGGSTAMVIEGKNVLYRNNPDYSRRLSVGVAAVKKSHKKTTRLNE